MSYNGIGLQTPRGSGTNGHISKNLSSVRRREPYSSSTVKSEPQYERKRQADLGILQHEAKRQIQNRVLIYQTELEDASPALNEREIAEKVAAYKVRIEDEARQNLHTAQARVQYKAYQTHDIVLSKNKEMSNLRTAFGVREDYQEGSAMKRPEKDATSGPVSKKEYNPNDDRPRNPLDRRRRDDYRSRNHRYDRRDDSNRSGRSGSRQRGRSVSADRWRCERPDFRARGKGYSPPRRPRSRKRQTQRYRSSSSSGTRRQISKSPPRQSRRRSRSRSDSSLSSRSRSRSRSNSSERSRSRSRHNRRDRAARSRRSRSRGRQRRKSPSRERSPRRSPVIPSEQVVNPRKDEPVGTAASSPGLAPLVFDRRKALGID